MYLNKVMIFGNLTRDPELKSLPSGSNVASFGIATTRTWKDRDGKKAEQTEFHNIVVFGKQAENCAHYLKKGSTAYVEGRLQTRSWEKEGVKQYRTEVIAETVQFGPRSASSGSSSGSRKRNDDDRVEDEDTTIGGGDINPDDIPF